MILLKILKSAALRYGVGVVILLALGFMLRKPTTVTVTNTVTGPTVTVYRDVVQYKDVVKYVPVADQTVVKALLAENEALKLKVQSLSLTTHTTPINLPATTGPVIMVANPASPIPDTVFDDWRLHFKSNGKTAAYTLTQKFTILNSIGRDANNVAVATTKLYEIGPGETKTLIPTSESLLIVTGPPTARFYLKLGVQGGWGLVRTSTGTTAPPSAIVALPWLHRGSTTAPGDTRWSFLTPAGTYNKTEKSVGILPISLNVGTLPGIRTVFTNIWVAPYFGTTTGKSVNRIGFGLVVKF